MIFHKHYILAFVLILVCGTSCKKFLDIEPRGKVMLKTISDFDLLLNGRGLTTSGNSYLNLMTDECDKPTIKSDDYSSDALSYLWQEQLTADAGKPPVIWTEAYTNIYVYNAVISQVENATTGTTQEKKKLKAEALLGRALEYLYLVNMFAKPYNKATADVDLSVPFVTSTDITTKTPARATVNFMYNQILGDIKAAIPDLMKGNNPNKFRGSVNAANSVLARAYFWKTDYAEAAKYAELVLADPANQLLDLNAFAAPSDMPAMIASKQEIYARYGTTPVQTLASDINFLKTFSEGDLRLKMYYVNVSLNYAPVETIDFTKLKRGDILFYPQGPVPSFGTSIAEMKLIIAEAAARSGDLSLALKHLNELRVSRMSNKKPYQPYQSSDQEMVLREILMERRHELASNGMRWIDMRRLDVEKRIPAINRIDANGKVIMTLQPGSKQYVLKIPTNVLGFNPDMQQN